MRNLIISNILILKYAKKFQRMLLILLGWLIVIPATLQGQDRAFVLASFPRNGAAGLNCAPTISLQFHFPNESQTLDPLTVTSDNIRLYQIDAEQDAIETEFVFKPETKTLSILPQKPLEPLRDYIVTITPGLVDDRGYSLRPFYVRFSTGACNSGDMLATRGPDKKPEPPPGPHVLLAEDSIVAMEEVNRIKWETYKERMIVSYAIARKTDTSDFRQVATIVCPGDNDSLQEYVWIDPLPSHGWNHYQITAVTILGDSLILDTLSHHRKLVAFPNTDAIWQGRLPVVTWLPERMPMVAIVRDLDHQIVRKEAGWAEKGQQFWTVELGVLDPGEYKVHIFLGKESYRTEILVTE